MRKSICWAALPLTATVLICNTVPHHSLPITAFMSFLPSFCQKDFLWAKKHTTLALEIYYLYLFLATLLFLVFSFIHTTYLDHKSPQATIAKIIENSGVIGWTLFFGIVLGILLIIRFHYRKQYTIKCYCLKRYLMAGAVMFLNILFIGNTIIGLYCSWANEIISFVILFTVAFFVYLYMDQLSERDVPIHYRLSKNTKIPTAQKVSMILFFAITKAFFIGSSFIDPLADEYVASGFLYTTRYFCPAINIIAIPIVYVAFLAYNSEEFAFSGLEPTSGRFWHGFYRRNAESGEWEYIEARPWNTSTFDKV